MSETPYLDRLARLDAEVERAAERRSEAKERLHRGYEVSVDATTDLAGYRDDVAFKRRPPSADVQRHLSVELTQTMRQRSLVFEAVGNGWLRVVDPRIEESFTAASRGLEEAKQERIRFAQLNGAEIEAERRAGQMGSVRDALAGDDPDRLREALAKA